jgi:VanZ family protein
MRGYARTFQFWIFILVTIFLSLNSNPPDALEIFSDKIIHSIGYLLLILSCDFAYSPSKRLAVKFFLLLNFSIIIEILQHFIPHRQFSTLDIIANLTGLVWGLLVIVYLKKRVGKVA